MAIRFSNQVLCNVGNIRVLDILLSSGYDKSRSMLAVTTLVLRRSRFVIFLSVDDKLTHFDVKINHKRLTPTRRKANKIAVSGRLTGLKRPCIMRICAFSNKWLQTLQGGPTNPNSVSGVLL